MPIGVYCWPVIAAPMDDSRDSFRVAWLVSWALVNEFMR